jgi:hypothetical protein
MTYRVVVLEDVHFRGGVFESGTVLVATDEQLHTIALWCRNGLCEPADAVTAEALHQFDRALAARAMTLH